MLFYSEHNENPLGNRVGDCTVRAISKALDQPWETTYTALSLQGFLMCDMPSANHVWGAYLRQKGWYRGVPPDDCPECRTVRGFCQKHPTGRYILALSSHVVAVVDGQYWDTWDSGDEEPLYYWTRKDDLE